MHMTHMEHPPLPSQRAGVLVQSLDEQEISLVDLFLVLYKRKSLFLIVLFLFLGVGFMFVALREPKFEYSAVIEIGTKLVKTANGEASQLIDSPETLLAKINEGYIPAVLRQYSHEEQRLPKIEAVSPKQSQLVVVKVEGPVERKDLYLQQIGMVLEYVLVDHERQIAIERSQLAARLNKARSILDQLQDPSTLAVQLKSLEKDLVRAQLELEELRDERVLAVKIRELDANLERKTKELFSLKNQAELYKAQLERLDQVDKLLEEQITELRSELQAVLSQRKEAMNAVDAAETAMVFLMIDNEIRRNRERLANLEERYFIKQKNARDRLLNQIKDNVMLQNVVSKEIERIKAEKEKLLIDNDRRQKKLGAQIKLLQEKIQKTRNDHLRKIGQQEQEISVLEAKLANIKETRVLREPMQSLEETGPGALMILILSGLAGLVLGLLAVFFAEFLARVSQKRQDLQEAT